MRGVAAIFSIVLAVCPGSSYAREAIGKAALSKIAPLGGSIAEARAGLSGLEVTEQHIGNGQVVLIGPDIAIGVCEGIYSVNRQLGHEASDGVDAVLRIVAVAGPPNVSVDNVIGRGGGQALNFSWDALSEYAIVIIKVDGVFTASERLFRPGFCRSP